MSSNISIQRICKQCNTEFTAKTTVTQFCSTDCGKKAYKIKERNRKIEASNTQTVQTKIKSIEILNSKEFLTVRDVASLLNCSIRTVYYLIENGTVMSVNLLKRKTIIKRSDINKLFEQPQTETILLDNKTTEISECYSLNEVKSKYSISDKALHDLIKRNSITKVKKGNYTYVPQKQIDNLFS
jgi:excisionase family DNA binding protein